MSEQAEAIRELIGRYGPNQQINLNVKLTDGHDRRETAFTCPLSAAAWIIELQGATSYDPSEDEGVWMEVELIGWVRD